CSGCVAVFLASSPAVRGDVDVRPSVGIYALEDVPGGDTRGNPRKISDNGGVVVGSSPSTLTGTLGEPVRWRYDGAAYSAPQVLGDLPGGGRNASAQDVSGDGSVIAGWSRSGNGAEAFAWVSDGGGGGQM